MRDIFILCLWLAVSLKFYFFQTSTGRNQLDRPDTEEEEGDGKRAWWLHGTYMAELLWRLFFCHCKFACNNFFKHTLVPFQSFFDCFCAYFHSSWWIQSTLLRCLRPVSSCWQCSLQKHCRLSLCLFCSTSGKAIILQPYFHIWESMYWPSKQNANILKILPCKHLTSISINKLMFSLFQGYALHNEPRRNEVTFQNGWNHCLCTSANYSPGSQCPLRTGTSGGTELAGVHCNQVNYFTSDLHVPYGTSNQVTSASLVCKDCSHTLLNSLDDVTRY